MSTRPKFGTQVAFNKVMKRTSKYDTDEMGDTTLKSWGEKEIKPTTGIYIGFRVLTDVETYREHFDGAQSNWKTLKTHTVALVATSERVKPIYVPFKSIVQ